MRISEWTTNEYDSTVGDWGTNVNENENGNENRNENENEPVLEGCIPNEVTTPEDQETEDKICAVMSKLGVKMMEEKEFYVNLSEYDFQTDLGSIGNGYPMSHELRFLLFCSTD